MHMRKVRLYSGDISIRGVSKSVCMLLAKAPWKRGSRGGGADSRRGGGGAGRKELAPDRKEESCKVVGDRDGFLRA